MRKWSRREWTVAMAAAGLPVRVRANDARNTSTPGTKTEFALKAPASLAEWRKRREELRRQILLASGLWPLPERGAVRARRGGRVEHEGFVTERVWLETLDGMWVAGNLYLPARGAGKWPGVMVAHGHWKGGRLEDSDECSTPRLGANLAMQGCVAFAYDMMGYNETNQIEHHFGRTEKERMWNFGPLGVQLWNSMRVLDFMQALPEVDAKRVAMTGASGGGTQTFLLAAVDERVAVSCPVNMVSAHFQGGCDCENAPGLRWSANNVEFASMAALRPQLLVAATGDWTKDVPRVEYPAVRRVYALYDRESLVETWQQEANHNYDQRSREAVYAFLAKHLRGVAEQPKEVSISVPQDALKHGSESPMPAGAKTREQLFAGWQARAQAASRRLKTADLRERLAVALGAEWPLGRVTAERDGERVVLSREGRGDRVPGIVREGGTKRAVLLAHPEGAKAAMESREAEELKKAGATVLALDLFQTGEARNERPRDERHFLTFNASDDACRVQDVLTGLAWLSERKPGRLEVAGLEKAALWVLFAKAVAPARVYLGSGLAGWDGREGNLEADFYAPGLLYAGGLEAAKRLAGEGG